jgi:FAD-linked oxidoreductase
MSAEMRNWSRTVSWEPRRVVEPEDVEAVADLVRACRGARRRLRVVGAAHSFTPIAATDDTGVTLDHHQGIVDVDHASGTATVRGGTRLAALGEELFAHGLAQENLGDVDRQSIAGAVATGTHGTGGALGSISTQVVALELVTGTGEVRWLTESADRDLLRAAQVSLGLLGVVTQVTLRVRPAYRLRYLAERRRLDDVLADLDELVGAHRHVEFFWFPYSEHVQLKVQDETDEPLSGRVRSVVSETLRENAALWGVSQIGRTFLGLSPALGRLSGRAVGSVTGVDWSHRVFASRRWARFDEMEYSLPREQLPDALRELRRLIAERRFPVNFPIEVRFVAGDDIWLSPAHGRESAYVAVHVAQGKPSREYFRAAEEILAGRGGRPHWGKVHSLSPAALALRYPHWEDFLALRAELDPDGVFLNDYLATTFGLEA